jgi:hypothetical protein
MIQELKVDVQGPEIAIVIRGTCLRMAYRKGDAPWLVCVEHGPDDPEARVTLTEFRALAWAAANAKARELGWIAYEAAGIRRSPGSATTGLLALKGADAA